MRMMFAGKPEELKQLESTVELLDKMNADERMATDVKYFNLARKTDFIRRAHNVQEVRHRFQFFHSSQ
jgi:hypothetical protein